MSGDQKILRGASFWDSGEQKTLSVTPSEDGARVLFFAVGDDKVVFVGLNVVSARQFAKAIEAAADAAEGNDE